MARALDSERQRFPILWGHEAHMSSAPSTKVMSQPVFSRSITRRIFSIKAGEYPLPLNARVHNKWCGRRLCVSICTLQHEITYNIPGFHVGIIATPDHLHTAFAASVPHNAGAVFKGSAMDGEKAVDKRVLCEQNPKQELYKEVQFLPT